MEYLKLHKNAKDLTGRKFRRLTALGPVKNVRDISGRALLVWHCRCDCGKEMETRSCNLLNGDTGSCGCYVPENMARRSTTHGHTRRGRVTSEFRTWKNMVLRCTSPKTQAYPWYGGRGIKVCERWLTFENFIADMGLKPDPKLTLEREDVNGHYEPDNCRWATRKEQGANMRNNRLLAAFGETLHMQEWCRRYSIRQQLLWDRLDQGWSVEDALTVEKGSRKRQRFVAAFGETLGLRAWAARTGIAAPTIAARLDRGEPPESAVARPVKAHHVRRKAST